jgi:predicted ATP-dependent protease
MDETFDIRLAALRRKIQQHRAPAFDHSVALLQTIALQNMQLQTAIQNLQPAEKKEEIKSYRRPRRYEGYTVREKSRTQETLASNLHRHDRKKRELKFQPRKKWKLLSHIVYFAMKVSVKYRKQQRDILDAYRLIEDGTNALTDFLMNKTEVGAYRDIIRVLAGEGCDVLVRDGIGFLFAKKPSKGQTNKFSNAVKLLVDMVTGVPQCNVDAF